MTGRVWLLSSALGVVCGGNSTLRSQKGAAGGNSSSSSNSSTHCHGEPGGPIPAQCLLQMKQPWAGLIWYGSGRAPRDSGRGSLANGGGQRLSLPGRGTASGSQLWAWVQFCLSPLVPEETAGAAGSPEVHNVLLKKVRSQLSQLHSAWLGGSPCPQWPEPGLPAGRLDLIPALAAFPSSLMVTYKQ